MLMLEVLGSARIPLLEAVELVVIHKLRGHVVVLVRGAKYLMCCNGEMMGVLRACPL